MNATWDQRPSLPMYQRGGPTHDGRALGSAAPWIQDAPAPQRGQGGKSWPTRSAAWTTSTSMFPTSRAEGARVLAGLKESGVDLLNFTAFPGVGGKTQIDLVPQDAEA